MKQNERSIVRKRTQQLVYLELGRDNGGVMLNLSEEGCGFQSISPVKLGKTRFAFQISGARRIAGDAEVEWLDEAGITGGLRFKNLNAEARRQIRTWLDDTNAPEEPGEGVVPAAGAPLDAATPGARATTGREASAGATPSIGMRQNSWPESGLPVMEKEAPFTPPWANETVDTLPILENERARFPLLRGDDSFNASRARSTALWRGIAGLAAVVAIGALLVNYQREVGSSLIWLGETLAGKTKTSVVLPESKPEETVSPSVGINATPAPEKTQAADAAPKKEPEVTPSEERAPVRPDAANASGGRLESVLEQQVIRQQKVEPRVEPRSEGESVESLWGAVQGGDLSAEVSLAERFARGDGVVKNCDQAKVLLKAASRRGSREATLRLYQLESGGCQ